MLILHKSYIKGKTAFVTGTAKGIGRAGTPEELAAAVLFVASDDASYVNGQNYIVDGCRKKCNKKTGWLPVVTDKQSAKKYIGYKH